MRLTKSRLKENKELTCSLLQQTNLPGIAGLVKWLCEEDYFTAPASTRSEYHGCHEGGLADHSLNVYSIFDSKNKSLNLGLTSDEIIISSLCHDICKVGIYVPNVLKSHKTSDAKPYRIEDDFPFGHGERSVLYASRHVQLTKNEMLLIRWHMGPYEPGWEESEERVGRVCPAIYAFHNSDMEASKYLDLKEK